MWLTENDYNFIYERVPRLTVDLIVVKENKVLLLKRETEPYIGRWHLPGGGVMLGESILGAIQRLAIKEIGGPIDPYEKIKFVYFNEMPFEIKNGKQTHSIALNFIIKPLNEPKNGEFLEINDELDMIPEHKEFLLKHII